MSYGNNQQAPGLPSTPMFNQSDPFLVGQRVAPYNGPPSESRFTPNGNPFSGTNLNRAHDPNGLGGSAPNHGAFVPDNASNPILAVNNASGKPLSQSELFRGQISNPAAAGAKQAYVPPPNFSIPGRHYNRLRPN